jgi:diguanylate cyclase (GGDEF)-like protein
MQLVPELPYMRAVLGQLECGVMVVDPDRQVVLANDAFAEMLGTELEGIAGMMRDDVIDRLALRSTDAPRVFCAILLPGSGTAPRGIDVELRSPRRVVRWASKPVQLPSGTGEIVYCTDVTDSVDLAYERAQLARMDKVTGLTNRRGAEEAIAREVSRSLRTGVALSFAMLKVHARFAAVLPEIARVLEATARGSDVVARWDDDRFLVVLPDADFPGAKVFAERAERYLASLPIEGLEVRCGLATRAWDETAAAAIARAEAMLRHGHAAA